MNDRVRAKKSLGQNFLVDTNYQKKIVAALDLHDDDEVIEIGPGTGALTQHMVASVARFTAIELDDQLAAALRDRYAGVPSFHLVHQDVLAVPLAEITRNVETAKIVGNIPYNITSPLLFHLLERDSRPALIVAMVQKEVADRIVALPGGRDFGALSVGIQAVAQVERLMVVPRGAFRPAPNVDSAVVRIVPRRPFEMTAAEEQDLRTLTRNAFGMRRKQLQKILRSSEDYALTPDVVEHLATQLGRPLTSRPEELAAPEFVRLSRLLRQQGYPRDGNAT